MSVIKRPLLIWKNQVPSTSVLECYLSSYSEPADKMIVPFIENSVWFKTILTREMAKKAHYWYSSQAPVGHVFHLLTKGGEYTNLIEVAENYLEMKTTHRLPNVRYTNSVEYFIEQLQKDYQPGPIIAVMGRLRREFHIIDGNTRSLAAAVLWLQSKGPFPELPAYIGRPALFGPFLRLPI